MNIIWTMTVALFINGESQVKHQQQFADLDQCIQVSRQWVREHAERPDRDPAEHITVSCSPANGTMDK